jgi:hypothetical protein
MMFAVTPSRSTRSAEVSTSPDQGRSAHPQGKRPAQGLRPSAVPAHHPCGCAPGSSCKCSGKDAHTIVTGGPSEQDTWTAATRTVDGSADAGAPDATIPNATTPDATTPNATNADAGQAGPGLDGGALPGGVLPACKRVSASSSLPSGTLPATLTGSKLGASWSMSANFTGDPPNPAICGPCGEYRQYVRGSFTKNGRPVTHQLCGTALDPSKFQEDCVQIGGTQYKYGYHAIPFATSKFSRPDQATGQRWDGSDAPGIRGSSGDDLTVDLEFMGDLVDNCNGATIGGSTWKVSGSAKVP